MAFIENFYKEKLTKSSYDDFLKGLINRKSVPHKDIYEDTRWLMGALKDYNPVKNKEYHWHRRQDHITYLSN